MMDEVLKECLTHSGHELSVEVPTLSSFPDISVPADQFWLSVTSQNFQESVAVYVK